MPEPPGKRGVAGPSGPYDSKPVDSGSTGPTGLSPVRSLSATAEDHPALKDLDPSTKFLYTPHTLSGLLLGEHTPALRLIPSVKLQGLTA